jgi:hypothetical protein
MSYSPFLSLSLSLSLSVSLFLGDGGWTEGLTLARQMLYT